MGIVTRKKRKPAITMSRKDHERLSLLAESFANGNAVIADDLLDELDRARIVPDMQLRPDVIRMGSTLRFTTDEGDRRRVTLVFPGEADIAEGKVSVLTPIGTALIGLAAGQSMEWTARDGRVHRLKVDAVEASGSPASPPHAELSAAP